jgi:dihydrofolate synthase/folylpolyglutamate synthase
MGGRFDSTNVLSPLLSIITKIDSDHNEYLGDSIQKIAYEKAGIIKQNTPCIISQNTEEVYKVIESNSLENRIIYAENNIDLTQINTSKNLHSIWKTSWNDNSTLEFDYPIPGSHQKDNLAAVFSTIKELKHHFNIEKSGIINGLKNVRRNAGLHARIELLSENPLIIIDGSHNSGSIENLFDTLSEAYPDKKWNMIFAVMADKNIENVFDYMKQYAESVTLPKLNIERASDRSVIAKKIIDNGIEIVNIAASVSEAFENIKEKNNILIFGSFYLAGEFLEIWKDKQ